MELYLSDTGKNGLMLSFLRGKGIIMERELNFKKWMRTISVATMSFVMTGMTVLVPAVHAAQGGSFSDVPANHWAYDAVNELSRDGIVSGYGDGTFQGDRQMSRYEFALIVNKAIENFEQANEKDKSLIDKLSAEFASELNRMGVRVTKVEQKTNTWVGGETRFRYVANNPKNGTEKLKGGQNFNFRQRLIFKGNVNEDVSYYGRIATSGTSKVDGTSTAVNLDMMYANAQSVFGLDSIRIGRSALDSLTNGLLSRTSSADGILVSDTWGKVGFQGWTGNLSMDGADSQQLTTGQLSFKAANNLNTKVGYYWADIPGTSKPDGTGVLNTNTGSFNSSKGWTVSTIYQMGNYKLIGDYVDSKLSGAANLPANPKAWAIELTNSKGPNYLYPAVKLVNPGQKGTDAWMVSYRSIDAGALPPGATGYDTTAVSNSGPYNVSSHATDNVNVLYLAYQNVIAKNVVMSLEYQDFRIKDKELTGLNSNKVDKTYMTKLEIFY